MPEKRRQLRDGLIRHVDKWQISLNEIEGPDSELDVRSCVLAHPHEARRHARRACVSTLELDFGYQPTLVFGKNR